MVGEKDKEVRSDGELPKKDPFHDLCEKFLYFSLAALLPTLVALAKKLEIPDFIFLAATLLTEVNLGLFYHWVLPYAKEPPAYRVVSLVLVIYMYIMNGILLVPALFVYRFLLLAGLLVPVMIQLRGLKKRFGQTPYGPRIQLWYTNVCWTFCAMVSGTIIFITLFQPQMRLALFSLLFVQGPTIQLREAYTLYLPSLFYLLFLVNVARSFLRNLRHFLKYGAKEAKMISRVA